MKKSTENRVSEILISAVDLENAGLNEWDRLELYLLDQTAVVIPSNMTAMELIRTAEALQGLISELFTALERSCEHCDNCLMDEPCKLMTESVHPKVDVPACVLEEAGIDPEKKLAHLADLESGEVRIVEADYRFDLTDLCPELLDVFRKKGICMSDLEEKLMRKAIIYG